MSRNQTTDELLEASAENLEGYLANIQRRSKALYLPSEGGRGNKRNREILVTSGTTKRFNVALKKDEESMLVKREVDIGIKEYDNDDEWETIDLTTSEPMASGKREKFEPDLSESVSVVTTVKLEQTTVVKTEPVALTVNDDGIESVSESEAKLLRLQRQNTRFAQSVALFVALTTQLRSLYRESHRPALYFRLLSSMSSELRLKFETLAKNHFDQASVLPLETMKTLAPCWVTSSKNDARSVAGQTIQKLLCLITQLSSDINQSEHPVTDKQIEADFYCSNWSVLQEWILHGESTSSLFTNPLHYCSMFLSLCRYKFGLRARLVMACDPVQLTSPKPSVKQKHRKVPRTAYWTEVWCEERQMFFSVNPTPKTSVWWNAPHVTASGGDHVVDVTERYIAKWSVIARRRMESQPSTRGFLWNDELTIPTQNDLRETNDQKKEPIRMKPYAVYSDPRGEELELDELLNKRLSPSQRILWVLSQQVTPRTARMLDRESEQLMALRYNEAVPSTVADLRKHSLYILEEFCKKFEAIYPRDSTTIAGYIRSKPVYRRSAIQQLRGRDGWYRLGRMVPFIHHSIVIPYKIVPLRGARLSPKRLEEVLSGRVNCGEDDEPLIRLYGFWQTIPFEPLPLNPDGTLPRHNQIVNAESVSSGNCESTVFLNHRTSRQGSNRYMLLQGKPPGKDITHLTHTGIAAVARRMNAEFAIAVIGFECVEMNRVPGGSLDPVMNGTSRLFAQHRWFSKTDGIVVPTRIAETVQTAYAEWVMVRADQEAKRIRDRALHWWRTLISQVLAKHRLEEEYQN